MSTIQQVVGARTALPFTGLSTLAAATYVQNTTPYDCTINKPLDVVVEVDATTTNAPAGSKQLVVFIRESLDGTNFRSGPTSGTSTVDEPNLRLLGSVPMNSQSSSQMGTFSVAQALGYCPAKFYVVIKNDLGVALTAGTVFTSEITSPIV